MMKQKTPLDFQTIQTYIYHYAITLQWKILALIYPVVMQRKINSQNSAQNLRSNGLQIAFGVRISYEASLTKQVLELGYKKISTDFFECLILLVRIIVVSTVFGMIVMAYSCVIDYDDEYLRIYQHHCRQIK